MVLLPNADLLTHRSEHVRHHQHVTIDDRDLGVHHEVPLLGGQLPGPGGRQVRVAAEHGDLGAEGLGVEGERLLGLALEVEICVDPCYWWLPSSGTPQAPASKSANADARSTGNSSPPPDGIRARAKSPAHDCPAGTGSVKHAAALIGAAAGRRRLAVVYSETEQPSDASYRGGDGRDP